MDAISEAPDPNLPASKASARLALVIEDPAAGENPLAALARRQGFSVAEAVDAASARTALGARTPDVVLLDIVRSDTDGLSVLKEVREEHTSVPIVVVTSPEDGPSIAEALELGALDFLRRPVQAEALRFALQRVSRALAESNNHREALAAVRERCTRMTVPCDPGVVSRVVSYLGSELMNSYQGSALRLPDVKLAVFEALANAVEHGNLEIGFEGKALALAQAGELQETLEARRRVEPYSGRKVHISVHYRPDSVEYVIRDEGPGFDPSAFDAGTALRDTSRLNGRGLALIRHHVDEVSWNERGNEIRLVYRLPEPRP